MTTVTQKSELFNLRVYGSSAFIFHLPTEILEIIFIDCARDYHSKDGGRLTLTVPSWVNVSYVCRHWRNVALECPTLWTYLFVTSPRWARELLARSKQAPLKLHVYPDVAHPSSSEFCFVEPVMNHVERIQELRLHVPRGCNEAQYFSKLSSPAPRLQNLKISTESDWSELSLVLFNGDTPALRTLELSRCPLPWYSFKLGGLIILSLYRVPVRFQENIEEFLATLRCMQNLQHLYLDSALRSAAGFLSSAVYQTFRKIDLPHLSRLWVAAPLSTAVALLSCVHIPLKTEIRLQLRCEGTSSPDSYAPFLSFLAQRFDMSDDQTPFRPKIRSAVVKYTSRNHGDLRLSASEHDCDVTGCPSNFEWDCNIPLKIEIRSRPPMTIDSHHIITDICCSLSLLNVCSLHVIDPPLSLALWRKAFGCLHELRYLKLSQGGMPNLAPMLSLIPYSCTEFQGRDADGGPNQIFAPALEELELDSIAFLPKPLPAHNMDWPTTDVQSMYMYDALSTRKGSRGRLTMYQCLVGGGIIDGKWEDFQMLEDCSRPWPSL